MCDAKLNQAVDYFTLPNKNTLFHSKGFLLKLNKIYLTTQTELGGPRQKCSFLGGSRIQLEVIDS